MDVIRSTLCYIEDTAGQYLMLHRIKKKQDANHDKWIGIGGKFESGESPEQCILREVKEETGLTLERYCYRGIVHFFSDEYPAEDMHLFTADRYHGQLLECDEGKLEWISKSKLLALPMWEGDAIFLRLLDTDAPFFRLTLRYQGDRLVFAELDGHILKDIRY